MILIKALLLFLLYDGTSSQQAPSQACIDVQRELFSNQACQQATIGIAQAGFNVSSSVLEAYCSPTCRDLVTRLANDCVS